MEHGIGVKISPPNASRAFLKSQISVALGDRGHLIRSRFRLPSQEPQSLEIAVDEELDGAALLAEAICAEEEGLDASDSRSTIARSKPVVLQVESRELEGRRSQEISGH